MEDIVKVFNEYADLAMKAHKVEDEMLDVPRSAVEKSGVSLDLLFVADNKNELFRNRLLAKYKELKQIERKRDQARNMFMRLLSH